MTGRLKIDPREGCWSSYPTGKTSTYKLLGIWRPLLRSTARCSCYYNTIPCGGALPSQSRSDSPSTQLCFRNYKFPDTCPIFQLSPHSPSPTCGHVDMVASLNYFSLASLSVLFLFFLNFNINIKLTGHMYQIKYMLRSCLPQLIRALWPWHIIFKANTFLFSFCFHGWPCHP